MMLQLLLWPKLSHSMSMLSLSDNGVMKYCKLAICANTWTLLASLFPSLSFSYEALLVCAEQSRITERDVKIRTGYRSSMCEVHSCSACTTHFLRLSVCVGRFSSLLLSSPFLIGQNLDYLITRILYPCPLSYDLFSNFWAHSWWPSTSSNLINGLDDDGRLGLRSPQHTSSS